MQFLICLGPPQSSISRIILIFQVWFLDNGVLVGKKSSVLWAALSILEEFDLLLGVDFC